MIIKEEVITKSEFKLKTIITEKTMLEARPDLFNEWNFEKNKDVDIYSVTSPSKMKPWWKCPKCDSDYQAIVYNRVGNGTGCSYCSGKKINHTNSLSSLKPELAKEWHPILNGEITPDDVSPNSGKNAWWLGKCGHEWDARISAKIKGNGCPICNNKRILIGYNDMWTTNPNMALMLLDPEDGYKYTQASGKKVDWKCPDCNQINKSKTIGKVMEYSLCCNYCSDGFKYPEKFLMNVLMQLDVDFTTQKEFKWLKDKKYDFYIPSLNIIIETHGGQHYIEQGYHSVGGRTLKDERENDEIKEKTAKENGIINYIVLDCRKSSLEHIKNSILNSQLAEFYEANKVDWNTISKNANGSKLVEACESYSQNKDVLSLKEISKEVGISTTTLTHYLKKGAEINLCDYKASESNTRKTSTKHRTREIVQLNLEGECLANWDSVADIARYLNKKTASPITGCCRGRNKTAYGFKWMYKEDYEKNII